MMTCCSPESEVWKVTENMIRTKAANCMHRDEGEMKTVAGTDL